MRPLCDGIKRGNDADGVDDATEWTTPTEPHAAHPEDFVAAAQSHSLPVP